MLSSIGIPGLLILFIIFILPILLCVWGYKDAKKNGKSNTYALGILILILVFPIIGWLIYLLIRKL